VFKFNEDVSTFRVTTVDQAPPTSVTNPVDITIGLTQVGNRLDSTPGIVFRIEAPAIVDRVNWLGVRVRSRRMPLSGGVPPTFTVTDYFPVSQPSAGIWQITHPTDYDGDYQYILTPVVVDGGVRKETTQSWLGRGAIHNRTTASDYPSNGNWLPRLSFSRIETNTVGVIQTTPLPTTDPKVYVNSFTRFAPSASFATNPNYSYFNLSVGLSHISNIVKLRIYRRHNVVITGLTGGALYYGQGRWEFDDYSVSSGSSGTFRLRAPISYTRFNPYATQPLLNTNGVWATKQVLAPVIQNQCDYFLVAYTGTGAGVPSSIGVMLPKVEGNLAQEIPVANFNTQQTGYQRRLTDAVARAADSTLLYGVNSTNFYVNPGSVG
jgi:hypothetical protein